MICKFFIPLNLLFWSVFLLHWITSWWWSWLKSAFIERINSQTSVKLPLQILPLMRPVEQAGERVSLAFHGHEDIFVQCGFWLRTPPCCSEIFLDASMNFFKDEHCTLKYVSKTCARIGRWGSVCWDCQSFDRFYMTSSKDLAWRVCKQGGWSERVCLKGSFLLFYLFCFVHSAWLTMLVNKVFWFMSIVNPLSELFWSKAVLLFVPFEAILSDAFSVRGCFVWCFLSYAVWIGVV